MNEPQETKDKKDNGRGPAFTVIDRRPLAGDGSPAPAEPRLPTYVEELKARAEEAERRARDISAAYRTMERERDAFRERLARDLERRLDIARADLLRKVLDVLDDLDRALASGETAADVPSLLGGVRLIRDRLFQVLASEGVEPIDIVGRRFDPCLAEAVAAEETRDRERDGLVLAEAAKGYTLRGTLLRPARVKVARCPEEPEAAPGD